MNEQSAVHSLTALAHGVRLRVFRMLVGAGLDGLTPSELAPLLGLVPSTLSFHLKELARADLVKIERVGRRLLYRPNLAHMNNLLEYLVDHCCQGSTCFVEARQANPGRVK